MTALRIRMIEDMQLRGFSERTQEAYVRAVRQLAAHYHKSPEQITEEELRQYFLYNKNIRKWSRTASTISLCGIKFFYSHTLEKEWTTFTLVRPPKEKKLPTILSRKEVRRIFNSIKMEYHRVCLITIYSLGLRLQEGTHLQASDIDSDRMFVHIHHGKGQIHMPYTDKPVPKASIQIAFKEACRKSKINKHVSVHHLRHAYAVHLLEAGVNLRFVQEYLGHSDPRTTMIYTRLINKALSNPVKIINQVMTDL